jgi:hypothetical protein
MKKKQRVGSAKKACTEELEGCHFKILGEQDGIPERELKRRLSMCFFQRQDVQRAYLVRVRYDGGVDEIALCVLANPDRARDLVTNVATIFGEMFGREEHLEIMLLDQQCEAAVSEVCAPFFTAAGSRVQ